MHDEKEDSMTPVARLQKAMRVIRQLQAIENRTAAQTDELAWWEKRVLMLTRKCDAQPTAEIDNGARLARTLLHELGASLTPASVDARRRSAAGRAKLGNEYARAFGRVYARTPKAVFAAVAYSYATWACGTEAKTPGQAVERFLAEWKLLNENGIVPQAPAKGAKVKTVKYIAYFHQGKHSVGVSFPDFPGCITVGSTLEDARRMAGKALKLHVAGMAEDGDAIPAPSTINAHDPESKGAEIFLVSVDLPANPGGAK